MGPRAGPSVTCRLGKRDLSNVLASILNGPDEVQEKLVPATATHWYRPPPPVLAPAGTLQRYPGRRSSYKC